MIEGVAFGEEREKDDESSSRNEYEISCRPLMRNRWFSEGRIGVDKNERRVV